MLKFLKCQKLHWLCQRNYTKTSVEMKYLNVAEKHDAAKTISGLLSNGTARRREGLSKFNKIFDFDATVKGKNCKMVMTSVSGHLLNLEFLVSYRNWRTVDPASLFDAPIRKSCSENYEPIKRTLEREIRGCQGLIIWTDCDREGENIGFEIIEVCRAIKPNIAVHRAIFSEITTTSVRRALQQLVDPDRRQNDAVNVRTELDLRTGAAITRYQTMRLQRLFPEKIADKLISYGSCQIPTLGFVAERYKEVEAFVSEPFWKIKVTHTIEDLTVDFNWARNRLFDKQACEDYLVLCLAEPKATVESVTVKPKSKWRPTPMDTVELEKLGSRKLKLSAKETMTIAEKLYTKGIISYPRTETNQFSKEIDLKSLVEHQTEHSVWGQFAQRVMEWGPNPRNGNKADQAHPPIHPLKLVPNLDGNEGRVYELICRHFLACVSKDAVGSETVVHIDIAGEKFTATGLVIFERNYLDVYIYDKWNAKQIHHYEQGQQFDPTEISMQEGATTAPPLLTEADLIALMEKHGIGTDATHAEHINTIKERGYVGVVDKGFLVPGIIGMGLYEGYDAMQLVLAKPNLRAEFEADLKKICLGEKDPQTVLREQVQKYKDAYKQITEKITAMDEKLSQRLNETPSAATNANASNDTTPSSANQENHSQLQQEVFKCPKCSVAPLALKAKKNQTGFFIGCLNFPDCKNTIWWPDECKDPTVPGDTCQICGSEVKMVKFRFATAYYKSMFNAPNGWYKTCLRCDGTFRNTFNINLEQVKPAGRIVGDSQSNAVATSSSIYNRNAISNRTTSNWGSSGSSASNTGGPASKAKKPSTKKPKTEGSTETKTRKRKTPTTTTTTGTTASSTNSNARNYFTSTSAGSSSAAIVAEQLRGVDLDDLFDSNDAFEDLELPAEADMPSYDDFDVAAAFAEDDDTDFPNIDWCSAELSRQPPPSSSNANPNDSFNWGSSAAQSNADLFDESFSDLLPAVSAVDLDNYQWGSGNSSRSHQTPPSSTAPKKPRTQETVNSNLQQQDIRATFQQPQQDWGEMRRTVNPNAVKCTGCHQEAKELTVRKDGPNKGRPFYSCPKSKPCKFFQWGDETSASTTDNNNRGNTSFGTASPSTPKKSGWLNKDEPAAPGVQCNCGKAAVSLVVRKEGPNKGRPFHSCPNRNKSCGFFKWADEADNQASTSTGTAPGGSTQNQNNNSSWGSRGNFTAVRSSNTSSGNEPKKRKCGYCRQEGHTKLKCPRKSEFDI